MSPKRSAQLGEASSSPSNPGAQAESIEQAESSGPRLYGSPQSQIPSGGYTSTTSFGQRSPSAAPARPSITWDQPSLGYQGQYHNAGSGFFPGLPQIPTSNAEDPYNPSTLHIPAQLPNELGSSEESSWYQYSQKFQPGIQAQASQPSPYTYPSIGYTTGITRSQLPSTGSRVTDGSLGFQRNPPQNHPSSGISSLSDRGSHSPSSTPVNTNFPEFEKLVQEAEQRLGTTEWRPTPPIDEQPMTDSELIQWVDAFTQALESTANVWDRIVRPESYRRFTDGHTWTQDFKAIATTLVNMALRFHEHGPNSLFFRIAYRRPDDENSNLSLRQRLEDTRRNLMRFKSIASLVMDGRYHLELIAAPRAVEAQVMSTIIGGPLSRTAQEVGGQHAAPQQQQQSKTQLSTQQPQLPQPIGLASSQPPSTRQDNISGQRISPRPGERRTAEEAGLDAQDNLNIQRSPYRPYSNASWSERAMVGNFADDRNTPNRPAQSSLFTDPIQPIRAAQPAEGASGEFFPEFVNLSDDEEQQDILESGGNEDAEDEDE